MQKPTRVRFTILAAIFVNVVINYMDRSNISVAATMITSDLKLTPVQLGYIFSAFGWTYAILQIPGGIMADRYGARLVYAFSLVCWSAVTIAQGFAAGFIGLFILRMLVGVFEAPAYPINNRIVTSWFPDKERATAIAIYTSGQFVGLAFLAPALTALEYCTGWKGLFIITGVIGIVWGIAWYFFYRDPLEHQTVNEAELQYIEEGGGLINRKNKNNKPAPAPFNWSDLKEVFSHRKLWGIYLGQFSLGGTMWFFLTWFPTYLVKYRGMNFIRSGFLASVPFLAAFAGILLAGFLSDYMIKKGVSASLSRKIPVVTGLLLSTAIIGANYVSSPALTILFMCIAFFGNGFASITWVFVSTLAPTHLLGLTGGVFNFIGGLAAVFIPLIIGYLVKGGSFEPALIFIGGLGITGALCYIFLVGKVERIQTISDIETVLH
ncbi:MAG: D-galactonate transporter [Ferruginibacter sp.]|uniref:MFS transporter n=1 Tax=Ferruginibacter sp. TaxID=1940288 RepID=UPI00265A5E01|nr:MFS transporter [Ferruginibacter sp.]MDB5278142.1 D-galactonate transporter [Ferruginibacter sp.]